MLFHLTLHVLKPHKSGLVAAFACWALTNSLGIAGEAFYVSTAGSDAAPGTRKAPFATLGRARDAIRSSGKAGRQSITVHVSPGVYYLPETLVLTAADSGNAKHPIVYQAEPGGPAIISGGTRLQVTWVPFERGIYRAKVPANLDIDQLFINGQLQWMARFPNREQGDGLNVFDTWKLEGAKADPVRDALAPDRVARWSDPSGAYLHAMQVYLWGGVHWRITEKRPDGTLALDGGTQNNRATKLHPVFRIVENVFEELDAPGEWYYDRKAEWLYYYPPSGVDLQNARVEIVRLRHLIELQGTPERPVCFLEFRGLTFKHAGRTFMDTREPLLRSDWTTYRGGAVFFTGTEDCALRDCEFDQVGGNSVFVNNYNRRVRIQGCLIRESGANGVAFVGNPKAVRSPLFNYDEPFDYSTIDRTPGPLTPDYPADCTVEDCLITGTGRVEKQTAGVQIAMAQGITVRHCSIYRMPRAGINIGDGCWGGHVIEFCDVFDTVLETGDHGSFNSWGRDRYWDFRDVPRLTREVDASPALPFLDVVKPIVLRNNRWRCDHGWDVDLDDGSSNYRIYNNLFLHGGLKLREGYGRCVWNNIAVNNSLHPHCWFRNCGDIVTNNIWMGRYQPALMPPAGQRWGECVDYNIFASNEIDREAFVPNYCDKHSLVADPDFVDPTQGNFQLKRNSPAFKLGFKNFPMDQFGVQKASLKSIAKAPRQPAVKNSATLEPAHQHASFAWRGARLRNLTGEEFSAYGTTREDGGIILLQVPDNSAAARDGFKTGDLVLGINNVAVRSIREMQNISAGLSTQDDVEIMLARKQSRLRLKVKGPMSAPVPVK